MNSQPLDIIVKCGQLELPLCILKKYCTLFVLLHLILASSLLPAAEEFQIDIPNRTVKVGLFPQRGYHDYQNGEPNGGYGYDYLQQIRQYAPFVYEYHCQNGDWSTSFRMLEEGKIDLMSNIRKTPEREKKFAFSKYPLGRSSTILTVKSGDLHFPSGDYSKWNGIRIGILKNNSWETKLNDYARQKGFTCKIVPYDDAKEMFYDLQNAKNIDACLSNNLRRLENEWILEQLDAEPFYIAVRKENADILAQLDVAMANLELNEPAFRDLLWQKYFSAGQSGSVIYSNKEIAFIKEMKETGRQFTAVLNPDRYPISYFTPEGHCGFIKEISDEIIRRTGLNIKILPIQTPEEYRECYKDPQVDIIFDSKYDLREAEKNNLNLSRPYISLSTFLLLNKKSGKDLQTVEKVVLIEEYRIADKIRPLLPKNVEIQFCRTTKDAIDLVTSGKCDATCLHTTAAEYVVKEDPYDRLRTQLLLNTHINLSVGTRESRNPLFTVILNKAVASIDNDFINQTVQKYAFPQTNVFSFARLFHRYPVFVFGLPILVLVVMCFTLWWILLVRRKAWRLGIVFDKIPIRYFFADEKGRLLQYGFGDEPVKPILQTLDDIEDETVRQTIKTMVFNAMATGNQQEELYMVSGRIRIGIISPLPKSVFGHPAVICISRDITELQKSRSEAHQNEEFFRLTLRSIADGVIATDKMGNVIMLNPVAERMMGVTLSEAKGKSHTEFYKIVSRENGCEQESPVTQSLRTGKMVEYTSPIDLIPRDGQNRYQISESSSPILDENGKIIGAILVFRDITKEYQRQVEIQEELMNWEEAARLAQIYHFKFDPETKTTGGSQNIDAIWPIKNGKPVKAEDWIYHEDLPEWFRHYTEVVEGKEKSTTVEYRVIDNGKTRYFRGFIHSTTQPDGKMIGLIQETTSFMELQQKANAMRTLWATCLETMPVTMYIKSAADDFRYLQCNTSFARFTGHSVDEIIGHNDRDLLRDPNDMEECRRRDMQVMETDKPVEFLETLEDAEGNTHHFRTVKVSSVGPDGKPVLLGMSIDETADYNHRQQINEMLEDWNNAARIAQIAGYRLDSDMRVLAASEQINDFWPISASGIPLAEEEYLHPDDVIPYKNMYHLVFSGEQEQATMLCRVPQPDGIRYLRLFIKRSMKRANEISGLIQDVTVHILEEKKQEALLSMWKNVIETVPALFFVKNADDDFRYLQANRNFCDQIGMEPKDIVGKKEEEFVTNQEEAARSLEEDRLVMESWKRQDFVEQIHIKDGGLRHYQTVKVPLVDEKGQRILISMSQDITDSQELFESRKIISASFEKLFTSDNLEEDIRDILKSICVFIGFDYAYICRIDEVSDTLQMYTAYHRNKLRPLFNQKTFLVEHASSCPWYISLNNAANNNVFCFDFSNKHDRTIAKCHIPYILDRVEEYDMRNAYLNYIIVKEKPWGCLGFITSGHTIKVLSVNKKRLLTLTSHIVELAITRQRTQDKLQRALTSALAADKAKNFFLSSMSHEIRTPLNAVIGFTDLLKDPELDQETREDYLDSVTESGHALLELMNDILELSKLASGSTEYHPVLTNIQSFVDELDTKFRPSATEKQLTLDFWADGVPDLYLDKPGLHQIFYNLISNAIKFTPQGGVNVSLEFKPLMSKSGSLIITVSDTGIGVVPEDQEKMFEPFIQMSHMRGTNAMGSGTGLGLAIVKKIVEQQGGSLALDSVPGRGSTFTIILPNVGLHSANELEEQRK